MIWLYVVYSVIALTAYVKLFCFKKNIDLQDTFIFMILHCIMVFLMIKVFMV